MIILRMIIFVLFCFATNLSLFGSDGSDGSDESENNIRVDNNPVIEGDDKTIVNELLATKQQQQITPNPNEIIDPFSGTLRFIHKDFSLPVAPGLNIEIIRSYRSDIYDQDKFLYDRHDEINLLSQSWSLHSGYVRVPKNCAEDGNTCKPVYITASGERITLLADPDTPGGYRSLDNWRGSKKGENFLLNDPNGFKYYFNHQISIIDCDRYYLTKIETPDGYFIQYQYDSIYLTKITSSDPEQVVTIENQFLMLHPHKREDKRYVKVPKQIIFKGKAIAQYGYKFIKYPHKDYNLVLVNVRLSNDKFFNYEYNFQDIAAHNGGHDKIYKEILTHVVEPGSTSVYTYERDITQQLAPMIHSIRLASVTRNSYDNNVVPAHWQFGFSNGPAVDGQLTKFVTIKNDYSTTVNQYFNYQNNAVWRIGLLINSTI